MRRAALLVAVLASACSSVAVEQEGERYGPIKGESLLSLAGSVSDFELDGGGLQNVKTTDVTLSVSYGYFLTTNNEIGGEVTYSQLDTNVPDADLLRLELSAFYNYNIRYTSRTWFYVGADFGAAKLDDEISSADSTDALYGLHVGARLWATPEASLFIEPFYRETTFEFPAGDVDEERFGVLFGIEFAL